MARTKSLSLQIVMEFVQILYYVVYSMYNH
jgi:hypothetical protein